MENETRVVSKVLVLEGDPECLARTRDFCKAHGLVGLKVKAKRTMDVLKSNVDLGGILIAEDFGSNGGLALARKIHQVRPELPIFLRRNQSGSLDDLKKRDRRPITAAYSIGNLEALATALDESIFRFAYPQALLRGISDISKSALESQFVDMSAETETPFIVRDQFIFGEIFTLIPIESSWCRGYMMLQIEEAALLKVVQADRTHVRAESAADFRNLNSVLGEITNLIWGSFKNRFVTMESGEIQHSQVPIMINHMHRYISFGTTNPQLCFRYTMTDRLHADGPSLVVYQKFVFNLSWTPEKFAENPPSVDQLVDSGELELF
jgi:hypothetical protein